jgi:DNA (cytosine-5)-methyltransferase 1
MQLRTGPWNLTDLKDVPKNGKSVFSIFHCGGGSTMGYKLAGYDVLGGVEIDPEMMKIYRENHKPKHSFLMGVQQFNRLPRTDIPPELFKLDILDGSPPCSSFSTSGKRHRLWGEKKKFREGQANQILDDLFFHYIETARILQPKVVIAENVKGLLVGKAKGYVKQIFNLFNLAGYDVQLFLLNASAMGVPQRRERSFFICRRKDLALPKINLSFDETPISFRQAVAGTIGNGKPLPDRLRVIYDRIHPGKGLGEIGGFDSQKRIEMDRPTLTVTATNRHMHPQDKRFLSDSEIIRLQTFPDDYQFFDQDVGYFCGMSVPPFMMQRVADQIYKQLLSGIN